MDKVFIAGQKLDMTKMSKSELKGLYLDLLLGFAYYRVRFNNEIFCLVKSNRKSKETPATYKKLAKSINSVLGTPVVFLFDYLEYYERNRLIGQDVYFVVSNKYAFLPYLIINSKPKTSNQKNKLTPAAQYLLLFHLQTNGVDNWSINKLKTHITSYNYIALTRAVVCLENVGLCRTEKDLNKEKHVVFDCSRKELWEKAQRLLIPPIKKIMYCDSMPKGNFLLSGLNALAHYSHINPDDSSSLAITEKEYRIIEQQLKICGLNPIEGRIKIEIWRYPAINADTLLNNCVDRLSLYLTLKDDKDARIEKEMGLMINDLW
ncbi:MAG: hypothetical protein A2X18_00440 [Bacteroidetes bacterium GWF2_40_14]|nr:MAG: hypothetical protein A2X18_00440 [Bacteroidetes bacterium GWF2_40_14]